MVNFIVEELVVIGSNPLPYLAVVKVTIFVGVELLLELSLFPGHPVWQLVLGLARGVVVPCSKEK